MVDRALTATVFSCDVERLVSSCPSVGCIFYERCHRGSCQASFSSLRRSNWPKWEEETDFIWKCLGYEGNSVIEPATDFHQLQVSVDSQRLCFCPAVGIQRQCATLSLERWAPQVLHRPRALRHPRLIGRCGQFGYHNTPASMTAWIYSDCFSRQQDLYPYQRTSSLIGHRLVRPAGHREVR